MKKLHAETGGRPRANDDLMALQEMILTGSGAPLVQGLPTCVLSGCAVTLISGSQGAAGAQYSIAPGIVYINNGAQAGSGSGIYDFAGVASTLLPGNFRFGEQVAIDQRTYQTGGTKTCISETRAEFEGTDDDPGLPVYPDGPVMWYDRVADLQRPKKLIEMVAQVLPGEYDTNGRGLGRNRGWQLCNGKLGAIDLSGKFIVGMDPNRTDYDTPGKQGGAEQVTLTTQQMPTHRHTIENAGSHSHRLLSNVDSTGNGAFNFQNITRAGNNNSAGEYNTRSSQEGDHTHAMQDAGGSQGHENRPPFYVLAFRQWVGL